MAYFPYVTFVSVVSFNDVTIPNKKNITRWLEDMNVMFEWQEQYLTSERSERVRYCSCHENIKFISSSSLLAGGYWGFHRGKPVPFGNQVPSWIFEARAPGYERASAKIAHFVNSLPGPDLAARIQDGDLITNSVFFFSTIQPPACRLIFEPTCSILYILS